MKIAIVRDYGADWAALYVDGKYRESGHHDDINERALELLEVDFYNKSMDFTDNRRGDYPENLSDLVEVED